MSSKVQSGHLSISLEGQIYSTTKCCKCRNMINIQLNSPATGPTDKYRRIRVDNWSFGMFMMFLYTISVLLEISTQLYIRWTRKWVSLGTILREIVMASASEVMISSGLASANEIMWGGSTSGTPPTFVETTKSPHDAASNNAMQKDSVNEQLRKMCPRTKT